MSRRPSIDALSIVSGTALAVLVAAGCDVDTPVAPDARAAGNSAQILSTEADVFQFPAGVGEQVGTSVLERGKNGITARLALDTDFPGVEGIAGTEGSIRGHAITIWALVFNDPSQCADGPSAGSFPDADGGFFCLPGNDFGRSGGDVMRLSGKVVGQGPRVVFAGRLKMGEPSPFGPPGPGLINPMGAEIHLIVRTHGPQIPGVEQLSSPGAGCEEHVGGPESGLIPTGERQCANVAGAAHLPAGF